MFSGIQKMSNSNGNNYCWTLTPIYACGECTNGAEQIKISNSNGTRKVHVCRTIIVDLLKLLLNEIWNPSVVLRRRRPTRGRETREYILVYDKYCCRYAVWIFGRLDTINLLLFSETCLLNSWTWKWHSWNSCCKEVRATGLVWWSILDSNSVGTAGG